MSNKMIDKKFIEILCCPKRACRGDLFYSEKNNKEILSCAGCKEEYPIKNGIPILYPNALYSPDVHKRHWDMEGNAKSYASKYDSYLKKQGSPWGLYTHESELFSIRKVSKGIDLSGKTIIDCGCGNGRLLSEFKEAKIKIGIDTSLSLLEATKKREPNFWLVCGQLEDIPFKDAISDFSVSIRVFQHLKKPIDGFSEMVRITKPSGFVALENYNKFNLKEVYKKIRMIPFLAKKWPWGLSYDRYDSYLDIKKWCNKTFVRPLKFAGAGWGFYFYLLEPLCFRRFAPKMIQKIIYNFFFVIEKITSSWPFFGKTMEKITFIGSIQGENKETIPEKISRKITNKLNLKEAKEQSIILQERNYCYSGSDLHHLKLSIDWLKKAQDTTPDAGVSRGWSFIKSGKSNKDGWQPSYPETTGYIIPTFLKASEILNDPDLERRARLMTDWEIAILRKDGSVHGGNISEKPAGAVFDTGQVIRGLVSAWEKTGKEKYLKNAITAGDWILSKENNRNGNWNSDNALSVDQENTTYNIYAISPLGYLGLKTNKKEFINLCKRAGKYTLSKQNKNGWFSGADFKEKNGALLHTVAYTIDGLWEAGEITSEKEFFVGAEKALQGVLSAMENNGKIAGRLDENWKGTVSWVCLTGMAQIGVICLEVYNKNNNVKYLESAKKISEFLKSCQNTSNDKIGGGLGAVWGSFPISGEYGQYQALNWPVKYFADLLIGLIEISKNENK